MCMLCRQYQYLAPRVPHAKGLSDPIVLSGFGYCLVGTFEQKLASLPDAPDVEPPPLVEEGVFRQRRRTTLGKPGVR